MDAGVGYYAKRKKKLNKGHLLRTKKAHSFVGRDNEYTTLFMIHKEYDMSTNTKEVVATNQEMHYDYQDFEISKSFFTVLSRSKPKGNKSRGDESMYKEKSITSKDQSL